MFINQQKLIFFRKGMPLLANVAGTAQSIPLGEPDFVMLECALQSQYQSGVAELVTQSQLVDKVLALPLMQQQFASLSPSQVAKRFAQYSEVKAISDIAPVDPPSITPIALAADDTLFDTMLDAMSQLRIGTHFAISFAADGFCAWSAQAQDFIALSALDVMVLLSFGEGKSISEILTTKAPLGVAYDTYLARISAWHQLGLLADEKTNIAKTAPVLTPFSTSTASALPIPAKWQDALAEDKIPVYFVPHMENHFPLALGVLYSALIAYQDGALLDKFQFIPLNYLEPNALFNGPYRKFGAGVWLFSNYMWSIDVNMQISQAVKQYSGNFTIHGGPSTPDYQQACEDFLTEHTSVNVAVHGEGEITITEVVEALSAIAKPNTPHKRDIQADNHALAQVTGITYREAMTGRFIRTGSRERMKNPDTVPSPYLSGLFDQYQGRVEAAIIETNRGCPYGCTFCDWGSATNQKIRKFDLQRVKDEITWIGQNKIRVMWIADANYGLYDRDIEISQFIVDTKAQYGYPQEIVVNYTKNSTWRLVEIIKIFSDGGIIGQGIISIQTTDEQTLEVINRKNIRTQRYDELAQAFTDLNLPLSTDLMMGLPGQTVASFTADLQRYIDMDVSVKAYPTQLLPNSPMAEPGYMEKYEIKTNEHSFLTSTYSYTPADMQRMNALYDVYVMADGYSLLRYVLRYMQWEHGVMAGTFLANLLDDCQAEPDAYPLMTWAVRYFNEDKSMPSGWANFYQELYAYICARYALTPSSPTHAQSALATVISVNQAAMPDDALQYPYTVDLVHDFVAYFTQNTAERLPLESFGTASMTFTDPNKLSIVDLNSAQYDSHQYFWELHSAVARPKSLAEFAG